MKNKMWWFLFIAVLLLSISLTAYLLWFRPKPLLYKRILQAPHFPHRVIVASDQSRYIQYWPWVQRAWVEFIGVRPHLIYIGSRPWWRPHSENITYIKPLPDIPTAFQAQCIRLLFPQTLPDPEEIVIISDIDLLPLSQEYFLAPFRDKELDLNTQMIVYRPPMTLMLAMSFVAGKVSTWRTWFPLETNSLHSWHQKHYGWFTDQRVLYDRWQELGPRSVHWGHEQLFHRLDKIDVQENTPPDSRVRYSDTHLPPLDKQVRDYLKTFIFVEK